MRTRLGPYFFLAMLVALPEESGAQEEARLQRATAPSWGEVSASVGMGLFGGDPMAVLQAGLDLREGRFALGLAADLRIKLADRGGPGDVGIRTQDWDGPSDYAHIIRYLSYWRDDHPVSFGVAFGEFVGETLGHGTLLARYVSLADLDNPHTGARLLVTHRHVDLELLAGDFVQPSLLAGRIAARPVPSHLAFTVALEGLFDIRAPGTRRGAGGLVLSLEERVEMGRLTLLPWLDLAWQSLGGFGLGLGGRTNYRVGTWEFGFGGAYRLSVGAFAFEYADSLYDVQRVQYHLGPDALLDSKAAVVAGLTGTASGAALDVHVSRRETFMLSLGYRLGRPELGDSLSLDLQVPYGPQFVAGLFLAKTGLRRSEDWQTAPGLLAGLDAKLRLWNLLFIAGRLQYGYWKDAVRYRGILLATVSVGFAWRYGG